MPDESLSTLLSERDRLREINVELVEALEKIVQMNIQTAIDQYGDASKAENWACVEVARAAMEDTVHSEYVVDEIDHETCLVERECSKCLRKDQFEEWDRYSDDEWEDD